jgi:RNA-directed DNA polymerase
MLAALQTGVKGGKWHSLIDKVSRLETLRLGWTQVERNAGAAGVDCMSVERYSHVMHLVSHVTGQLRDGLK